MSDTIDSLWIFTAIGLILAYILTPTSAFAQVAEGPQDSQGDLYLCVGIDDAVILDLDGYSLGTDAYTNSRFRKCIVC